MCYVALQIEIYNNMKKLLIFSMALASTFLGACAEDPIVSYIPGIYKVDIRQGNVLTQVALNQLQPGMTRQQVRYVLGTPLVVDVFHQNRWDYLYYDFVDGATEQNKQRISVYFEDDKLFRLDGDQRPGIETEIKSENFIVDVPPQKLEDDGLITRALKSLGILGDETEFTTPQQEAEASRQKQEKSFVQATLERFGLGSDEPTDTAKEK